MGREQLVQARARKGWSQEQVAGQVGVTRNTYGQWERGTATPYPIHVQRLCELFGQAADELGLIPAAISRDLPFVQTIIGDSDDILAALEQGVSACVTLAERGERTEMQLATQIAVSYIPLLQTTLEQSSQQRQQAATLLTRVLQIKQGSAYHLEGLSHSLQYAEQSLEYARISENPTDLVIALHHLATLYEWPLPGLNVSESRKKGLTLLEEAVFIQEHHPSQILPVVRAWAYIGLAKFQALCAQRQEAYVSIGKANAAYDTQNNESIPGLYFNETNLIRQTAIAHSYLHEQPQAVAHFLCLLDVNDAHLASILPMPPRTHLSLVSESIFSLLRLPTHKKDRELTIKLWKVQLDEAQKLQSATYLKEVQTTYQIMECVWPDDPAILELRDLFTT